MIIYDIFQVLLWVTAILLVITGLDDAYLDLCYWMLRRRYKKKLPDFSQMMDKPEKPIAILLGAWKESSVIGRTLSYAVRNLKYTNYRLFVGCYPNDPDTIRVVKEISRKDNRVVACINPKPGPSTKADNLNSMYTAISEYENVYGAFEIMIVHDAEDFTHPMSLKLFNFLIGYKGYHAVQIPVIPIKSRLGGIYHRTYCDAFAEVHTKDMVVRQGMGTFIPFSGTGMAFHRKSMVFLEKYSQYSPEDLHYYMKKKRKDPNSVDNEFEAGMKKEGIEMSNNFFKNDEEVKEEIFPNTTSYRDDPFKNLNGLSRFEEQGVPLTIKHFTMIFFMFVMSGVAFLIYTGNAESGYSVVNNDLSQFSKSKGDVSALSIFNSYEPVNEDLIRYSNNYRDSKYDVMYMGLENGKIAVCESVYKSESEARNKLVAIKKYPDLKAKNAFIAYSDTQEGKVFKILIGEYGSVDEARNEIIVLKQIIPQLANN